MASKIAYEDSSQCEKSEIDYSLKTEPILTAGKFGKGDHEFRGTRGLALDESFEKVYVVDLANTRIHVLSFKGDFLSYFGEKDLMGPWGIAVTEEFIYITDLPQHILLKYSKPDLKLIHKTGSKGAKDGELDWPEGLAVDTNGDVYIADHFNHRISVFSGDLNFKHNIGKEKVRQPKDVKLTSQYIIVLDWNDKCIHYFDRKGDLLRSCISDKMKRGIVYFPAFFCLDKVGNIIISDCENHTVRIFSGSGKLMHTIGKHGEELGEFIQTFGVAISKKGIIYVSSYNPSHTLQCF